VTRRSAPRAVKPDRAWRTATVSVAVLALATAAFAQAPAQQPPQPVPILIQPPARAGTFFPPDLIQSTTVPSPARSQRPAEPLSPAVTLRLQRAIDLRVSGLPERARDTLIVLLRLVPHHPLIVSELGRTQLARADWSAVERLATSERAASRDSTLLGRELAEAFERLARPREALRTALEAWTVSPVDGQWAAPLVFRLAPLDARGTAVALEAVTTPRPWRTDLTLGLARLYSLSGRPADVVRVLADAEKRSGRTGLRVLFADESLRTGAPVDTTSALAVLTDLCADAGRRPDERVATARRAWTAVQASGREAEWTPRLVQGLHDVPADRWGPEFLLALVRALQHTGHPAEARALLAENPMLEQRMPELRLEHALGLAREGALAQALPLLDSLSHAWPPARFMLAEVQLFSGELDSAAANYGRVAEEPNDPDAATALDRLYLLEESPGSPLRPMLGLIAYERWRGRRAAATLLADSLWRMQAPHGPYAARAGLELAELRTEANDVRGALVPLLVVCDSLADDRLAPLARQRAGDAYSALGDETHALAQYEECLARYPRAWNSPEVRRRVEKMRRDRRL
jgi:tetratricopeptide (TPR) repeat protein